MPKGDGQIRLCREQQSACRPNGKMNSKHEQERGKTEMGSIGQCRTRRNKVAVGNLIHHRGRRSVGGQVTQPMATQNAEVGVW